jgi:alpha-D-ribose 1-methylphosphonate 5-triphosphate synthase subunit PhnL
MNAWCELQFQDKQLEDYSRTLMRKLSRTVWGILIFAALYSIYKLELYTIWQEHEDEVIDLARSGAQTVLDKV